jgi:hypothetical protein
MSDNPPPESFTSIINETSPEEWRKLAELSQGKLAARTIEDMLPCPPADKIKPDKEIPGPTKLANDSYKTMMQDMLNRGAPCWLAGILAQGFAAAVFGTSAAVGILLWMFEALAPSLLPIGLKFIDVFRKDMDPEVGQVSILVLNELLGTDFKVTGVATKKGLAAHLERAFQVGSKFHQQMLDNFTADEWKTGTVGRGGAERLTGQIINFGTATALLGLAGEVGSVGLFKDFRLIGEQVTSGLGLGRLNRFAMKPLVKTTVELPYTWWLNKTYRPTQFKPGEVINPFTSQLMDKEHIYNAMALAGYSDDKTEELIKLHQKRLSLDDVEILKRWGYWSEDVTHKYLVNLGWPEELADTAGRIPELKRIDGRINKYIDKLEAAVDAGHLAAEDALALIKPLPVTEDERAVIQTTMMSFAKVPHRSLTFTEISQAFADGLLTVDDMVTRFQQLGFNGDDLSVVVELVLLKFAKAEEAKAAAAARHSAAESKAKAKGTKAPKAPPILSQPANP